MRLLPRAIVMCLLAAATPMVVLAASPPTSVFSEAAEKGEASATIPEDGEFSAAVRIIKRKSGDNGPVVLLARRLVKFNQQPQCARIGFVIGQPSANVLYTDMGGQLNICVNGEPPLRMCKAQPSKLVPPDAQCPDGSMPVDTPEVATAIATALATGSLSPQQAAAAVRSSQQPMSGVSGGKK
ncbi:hypothetical protein DBB29_24800 [Pandoraea cepalis]|uniref:Uncharacterized protein n=1 Tax=Pandoraea cepalis TaxID=2508294 RepID=A0AAW7MGU6_9BURK|nr:hypothetical protein [Pandoraea cepalis]MDN4571881.1 hypothetical protein [Pandoraea cepalis]MDN4581335.1 hypothetical protein [Pandoraea cepalis]